MHRLSVCVITILFLSLPVRAADFWVKNGGNDTLDGSSPANAWATLAHAAAVVNSGDTVHVLDGTYQGFDLRRSGTAGAPITFHAEGSAAQITADNGTTPDGINVENAAYVIIDGFVVNNRTRAGIRVAVSQFVTVRHCHTGQNGHWGIFSGFADDFTVELNETHHSQTEHGIYVSNSCVRPVIRGNVSHDNYANGIHMNGDLSQGGSGLISSALVERNIIYGNGVGGGSGINMDGVINSTIRNNLLYDNHASGISLYQIDGATGYTGNVVVNNTIVNAADGRWCVNINSGSTGNQILNNILYNYHSFRGVITIDASSRPGFSSDYNSVMNRFSTDAGDTVINLPSWQALGYDAHSFLATPTGLFVAPGSDFHLLAGCAAVDAGTASNAPSDDLDGNPRPVGAAFDVGAYELQLSNCGNGTVDPGEQCGEPGLTCTDPCTTCSQCICVLTPPVCGDGLVCGSEQCETNADCTGGQLCSGCQCVNPPACQSGITIDRPSLRLRSSPLLLHLKGQAVIPKPWMAVDPLANGIRVVVDALRGPGGIDVTIPGGAKVGTAGWTKNTAGTRWRYRDPAGSHGGVTSAAVVDRSSKTAGLLQWSVIAKVGSATLPDVSQVRTAARLGAPLECASLVWNPPGGSHPRCTGDSTQITCR